MEGFILFSAIAIFGTGQCHRKWQRRPMARTISLCHQTGVPSPRTWTTCGYLQARMRISVSGQGVNRRSLKY